MDSVIKIFRSWVLSCAIRIHPASLQSVSVSLGIYSRIAICVNIDVSGDEYGDQETRKNRTSGEVTSRNSVNVGFNKSHQGFRISGRYKHRVKKAILDN